MGHTIRAIVGAPEEIARVASIAECPAPTKLAFGLEIVPLGYEQFDRLTALQPGKYLEGTYLSEGLQNALIIAAGAGRLAYIETNYFGGTGSQAAAVFAAGAITVRASIPVGREPIGRDGPINTALRALGVEASAGEDEFDTVGLGRFRDLESLGLEEWDDD